MERGARQRLDVDLQDDAEPAGATAPGGAVRGRMGSAEREGPDTPMMTAPRGWASPMTRLKLVLKCRRLREPTPPPDTTRAPRGNLNGASWSSRRWTPAAGSWGRRGRAWRDQRSWGSSRVSHQSQGRAPPGRRPLRHPRRSDARPCTAGRSRPKQPESARALVGPDPNRRGGADRGGWCVLSGVWGFGGVSASAVVVVRACRWLVGAVAEDAEHHHCRIVVERCLVQARTRLRTWVSSDAADGPAVAVGVGIGHRLRVGLPRTCARSPRRSRTRRDPRVTGQSSPVPVDGRRAAPAAENSAMELVEAASVARRQGCGWPKVSHSSVRVAYSQRARSGHEHRRVLRRRRSRDP